MLRSVCSILVFSFGYFAITPAFASGEKVIASSGNQKVALIELFSSESCSSCPPTDLWFSGLESNKDIWSKFVPIVFHVDYWNHLDWKDELSSGAMTTRQIAVSKTWAQPSVYTPAIVVSGKEWRNWRSSRIEDQLSNVSSSITLQILQNESGRLSIKASGLNSNKQYVVHLAKLGIGLSSKVTAGENSGKTLGHSFVALDWQSRSRVLENKPVVFDLGSTKQNAKKYAVVAWIEEVKIPIALQATGGYL